MFQTCFCSHSHSRSRSPSSYLSPLPSTFIPFSTSTLPSYSSFFSPLVPHNTFLAFFSFRSTILFRRRCTSLVKISVLPWILRLVVTLTAAVPKFSQRVCLAAPEQLRNRKMPKFYKM
jgi:hypothetical protein